MLQAALARARPAEFHRHHVTTTRCVSLTSNRSYTRDVEGRSALVHAVRSGHAECCAELVWTPQSRTLARLIVVQVLKNRNALSALHQPGM